MREEASKKSISCIEKWTLDTCTWSFTRQRSMDKVFCCLFPSLSAHVHCTRWAGQRNNSEKVTIRTATVITCNFNPFSANFICWEIFLWLCVWYRTCLDICWSKLLIKSLTKRLLNFLIDSILLKIYGFFFNVSSGREENWTGDGRESVKIS